MEGDLVMGAGMVQFTAVLQPYTAIEWYVHATDCAVTEPIEVQLYSRTTIQRRHAALILQRQLAGKEEGYRKRTRTMM